MGASHTKKECKVGKNGGQWEHFEKSLKSSDNPNQFFPAGSRQRSTKGAHCYRLRTINQSSSIIPLS